MSINDKPTRLQAAGAVLALAFTTMAPGPAHADPGPNTTFNVTVPYNHASGSHTIQIQCNKMESIRLQDGATRLAPTMAFLSQFNPVGNTTGMELLSQAQKDLINNAGSSRSMERDAISGMLVHLQAAHGVSYEMVRNAALRCEGRAPAATR